MSMKWEEYGSDIAIKYQEWNKEIEKNLKSKENKCKHCNAILMPGTSHVPSHSKVNNHRVCFTL